LRASKHRDYRLLSEGFVDAVPTLRERKSRRPEILCRVRALLAEIYGWFTEGFDTADLKEGAPRRALVRRFKTFGPPGVAPVRRLGRVFGDSYKPSSNK
jgi:hypothetical protein